MVRVNIYGMEKMKDIFLRELSIMLFCGRRSVLVYFFCFLVMVCVFFRCIRSC